MLLQLIKSEVEKEQLETEIRAELQEEMQELMQQATAKERGRAAQAEREAATWKQKVIVVCYCMLPYLLSVWNA